MARRDALLRLRKTLLARRDSLCQTLTDELANLHDLNTTDSTGDSADAAFEASSDEMSSQLAELDSRELARIERALERLHEGMYGICEGSSENCQRKIPLTRLNALPYTTLCINCEREMENSADWLYRGSRRNWAKLRDSETPMDGRRFNLSGLERELSGTRRS